MRPRTRDILADILASIQYIDEDTAGMSFEVFIRDRRARQLVVRNFEIIGEALNRLRRDDPTAVEQVSSVHQYIALRNVLIHGYDIIDYSVVWQVMQRNLPDLDREISVLLRDEPV